MAILHIVLFKLKPNISQAQIAKMKTTGQAMVGVIPGLRSFEMGPPLASTAHRAKGFDLGIMTVMETEQDVLAYADHPAHQK
ncbi:hypothetical protein F5Y15DRAFT_413041 [Xylariaceae sp. FL0016]|nr:hypothetical protein F5Y15DRAFT_413041 [Xylariaceae sp. FL0016]